MKDSPPTAIEQVKLTPKQTWFVLSGLVVGLRIIWTACDRLLSKKTPAAAQEQSDICVTLQQQAGDGIIDADGKCDYLKRQ